MYWKYRNKIYDLNEITELRLKQGPYFEVLVIRGEITEVRHDYRTNQWIEV